MNPTERFSSRVDDYSKHRPSYPPAVFDLIDSRASTLLLPRIAADVGSGTGIFTRELLARGWTVHAIEPNQHMRAVAERTYGAQPAFVSRATTAEATGLPDSSVSLITAAQSFHWFDHARCQSEWHRILVPGGFICLVWNVRRLGSAFMDAYDTLLTDLLPEYRQGADRHRDAETLHRFLTGGVETLSLPHRQSFDWDGLVGRTMSSSYVPRPTEPLHEPLFARLRDLFNECQVDGRVDFLYDTQVTIGRF